MENNNTNDLFGKGDLNLVKVAERITKEHNLIYSANKFYEYRNGCYQHIDLLEVKDWVLLILGDLGTSYKTKDVVDTLKVKCYVKPLKLNNTNLLNVKNGMLDVNTLALINHDLELYSTVQIDVTFDKDAKCSLWEKTINEIFEGNEVKINLLQEFFGLCFTKITKYQKALFCIGEGANGKSTLIEVLGAIIGKENCSAVSLESFGDRHYIATLHGKLVNISTETNAKQTVYDNIFKAVVTGDMVQADEKFEQSFTFHPFCKLIFAVNNMPRVDDKSQAFFRRLLILRFEKSFGENERNPDLKEELLKEKDGIFAWALKGYQRLARRGQFEPDKTIQAEVSDYKMENNNVLIFVDQECRVKEGLSIPKSELFNVYKTWCEQNGFHALSSIKFSKELRKQYPLIQEGRDSDKWFWLNIDLSPKTPVNAS